MKNLETWLREQRNELPDGCHIAAAYCEGMSRIVFQIYGPFSGSPWSVGDENDITDAMLKVQDKIRELQTRMRAS